MILPPEDNASVSILRRAGCLVIFSSKDRWTRSLWRSRQNRWTDSSTRQDFSMGQACLIKLVRTDARGLLMIAPLRRLRLPPIHDHGFTHGVHALSTWSQKMSRILDLQIRPPIP